jgi:hypothetical protein
MLSVVRSNVIAYLEGRQSGSALKGKKRQKGEKFEEKKEKQKLDKS